MHFGGHRDGRRACAFLILASVGVPPEGIGLVLGVDRFLDMCRTTLNVIGDLVAATVVSAGVKDEPVAVGAAD